MSATPPKSPPDIAPREAEPWVRDLTSALRGARDSRHAERGIDMDQILTDRAEQRARWDAIEAAEAAAKKAAKEAQKTARPAAEDPPAPPDTAPEVEDTDEEEAAPQDAPPDAAAMEDLIAQNLADDLAPDEEADALQMPQDVTYDGGYPAMLNLLDQRRAPVTFGEGESLPPLDVNLAPYCDEIIDKPSDDIKRSRSGHAVKYRALSRELKGLPKICLLHALLVANLRKQSQPEQCAALFVRLWAEHSDILLDNLNARWQVSAITTFSEHGLTEAQRRCGLGLSVLLNTMKLYETERLYSGSKPKQPHRLRNQIRGRLPMEMDTYSLVNGGLDVALLGRLWIDAEEDEAIRPLAQNLLEMLNADTRNVFRRMRMMRVELVNQRRSRAAKRRALMAAYDAALEAEEAADGPAQTAPPDLGEIAKAAAEKLAAEAAAPARPPEAAARHGAPASATNSDLTTDTNTDLNSAPPRAERPTDD